MQSQSKKKAIGIFNNSALIFHVVLTLLFSVYIKKIDESQKKSFELLINLLFLKNNGKLE